MRKGLYIGILGLLAVLVSIGGVALFYRDYQSQLAQNVLLEKKLKEAQEISKEAELSGYSMVMDIQNSDSILWYSQSVDITDSIISRLSSRKN